MPRILVSRVVNALADKVWAMIRQFDAVVNWLLFVKSRPLEDGGNPTRVGCVRVLTQTDGEVFREVPVAPSDAERSYFLHVRQLASSNAQPPNYASCVADNRWRPFLCGMVFAI
ncbi:MAG: SRPBCC family protein [Candidatus Udaeobacter sp.]